MNRTALMVCVLIVAACSSAPVQPSPSATLVISPSPAIAQTGTATFESPSSTPQPTAAPTSDASALPRPIVELSPGRYIKPGFKPIVEFTLGDGWTAAHVERGFFDVERDVNSPDVIAVQFADVDAQSLGEAVVELTERSTTRVVEQNDVTIDGRPAFNAVIETTDPPDSNPVIFEPVINVAAGPISVGSGRRLSVTLVEVSSGILGIFVGGSIAKWDDAVRAAAPVLDSVKIVD
jgi:hypothetical protein